jgi:hypothetical protein
VILDFVVFPPDSLSALNRISAESRSSHVVKHAADAQQLKMVDREAEGLTIGPLNRRAVGIPAGVDVLGIHHHAEA